MTKKQLLTAIDDAMASLKAARKALSSNVTPATTNSATAPSGKKPAARPVLVKRGISEEGRQRIAEAQRKRWAAKKRADKKAARQAAA